MSVPAVDRIDDPRELLRESAAVPVSAADTAACLHWLAERREAHRFRVEPVDLDRLAGWHFTDGGDLRHDTGRFFSVRGLRSRREDGSRWTQPVLDQPEIGILGILVTPIDGVLHCLMQAKMEPGNSNVVQLSPTVQATRSNYTRVHQGGAPPYLEHFVAPRAGRVLSDALQTEQSSWFLRKRNRNMVVETTAEVPVLPDFRWLTLAQVYALLRVDNVVNMDARTVLAGLPLPLAAAGAADRSPAALSTDTALLSWLTERRSRHRLEQQPCPLGELVDWIRAPDRIERVDRRQFSVRGVAVRAGSREVTAWSQPMLRPAARADFALVVRRFDGVPHALMRAHVAAGTLDEIELGPTVQWVPAEDDPPRYAGLVDDAAPGEVRYRTVLSEEGGRFYHALNRYTIVETAAAPVDQPDEYRWLSIEQLGALVQIGQLVNVEARSLLAAYRSRDDAAIERFP